MGAIAGLRAEIEDIQDALRRVFDKLDALILEREELGKRWVQSQEEIARLRAAAGDASAEIDRLREYCDAHGMPGLTDDGGA